MAPSSQELEPPANPGRFRIGLKSGPDQELRIAVAGLLIAQQTKEMQRVELIALAPEHIVIEPFSFLQLTLPMERDRALNALLLQVGMTGARHNGLHDDLNV